jgi:hypothetical protein
MSAPTRERRIVLLAVASLGLVPRLGARAQTPTGPGGAPVIVTGAPAPPTGASVTVIDSAEIAASGASTLSDLLMARVPGLSARYQGGMQAEGAEVSARGMTAARGFAPMLVIDGILADGDQAMPVPGTRATISRLDDLVLDDIQHIEVLRGPAASARYGFGGGAGVIAVTTRRGSAGAPAFDVTARVGITDVHADFPANYQLTSGAPGQVCNPHLFAASGAVCTPTTLYSWSPLAAASPFRVGRATSAHAAISGTTFGSRAFAAMTAEHVGGVTADDWQSRLGFRASVERELPGQVTVSAQGSYLERDASVPARGEGDPTDNVVYRGLMGSAYNDSVGGYASPTFPVISTSLPEPSLVRVTSALRIGWRPLSWLAVDALGGQDRARTSARRADRTTPFGGTSDFTDYDATRWTSGTMHVGVDASSGLGTSVRLSTHLAYDDVRARDVRFDSLSRVFSPGGFFSLSTTWQQRVLRTQEATLRQHVGWSDALDVNAVTRWPVGRGVAAPLGVESSRSVDASLRLPKLREGLDLRLRAAAGRMPLVPPLEVGYFAAIPPTGIIGNVGTFAAPLRARRNEVEAGLDASIGRRALLQLTWFDARSSDLLIGTFLQGVSRIGGISDRGLEALISARIVDGPRVGWRTTVTATTLRSRVTSLTGSATPNDPYQVGYSPQGVWQRDYTWSDANADGYIGPTEVTAGFNSSYAGPSVPTIEVGVRNALTLPGALTLSALLDYRGGQYRDDETERFRCLQQTCLGLNDLSLSLEEQARWVAASRGIESAAEPASFLRLREVVLEWAPAAVRQVAGARRLSVRLVGQNLATWTRYPGIDPEVGTSGPLGINEMTDLFQGPLPRRVSLELRVGAGGSSLP